MKNNKEKLLQICNQCNLHSKELTDYFKVASNLSLKLYDLSQVLCSSFFETKSIDELQQMNEDLYKEVLMENYKTSYANPTYCIEKLGDSIGQALSAIYVSIRSCIRRAFKNNLVPLKLATTTLINAYDTLCENDSYDALKASIEKIYLDNQAEEIKESFLTIRLKTDSFYRDIIMNSDLTDLRYLYKSGLYISQNEIKTAQFFNKYDADKIDELAKATVNAYISGFKRDNKDIALRKNVTIIYSLGQEKLLRAIINEFSKHNLYAMINSIETSEYNKQYSYDHRFDNALYINEEYIQRQNSLLKEHAENMKDNLKEYSGVLAIEKFGETPFSPVSKEECLKLSKEQNKLYMSSKNYLRQLVDEYNPENETSFCIIAFPSPEIGDDFEDIFADICRINMLDSCKYEIIQQKIIDALDKGDFVHVKGKGNNKTDIMVKMQELKDPTKETNFENCVADVNIPVGEVFTSPMLKGTTGILHLEETFLDLKYHNLTLTFTDGYVTDYTCSNFDNEEKNKKYVHENLLFPHDTLPLGEFAIGTNTLAYVISEKYKIIDKLPVLIIEKMGPHFAIGDTCFSFGEDNPVYNPLDNKEITARDNEKSLLRKTNIDEAYTNIHTDITLPYDGLEFITVLCKNGDKIDIIRDGRFVLEGTEELNKAFDEKEM